MVQLRESDRRRPPRVARLLADLLVFDPARFAWRLGLRTVLGLLPPLILGRIYHLPELYLVGLAAYLLALGEASDDGDHLQLLRLNIGAVLSGVAFATGVLAGASLPLAILGTMVWGFLAGLMGVYGNAFMIMGLPIAWAYAEVGLAVPTHSLINAARLGALYTLGGGIVIVLTWLIRTAGPYYPLKHQTALCFRALAGYLGGIDHADGEADVVSPETRVRSEIIEARRLEDELRRGRITGSTVAARLTALIGIADEVFSLTAASRGEVAPNTGAMPPPFADAARVVAGAVSGLANRARLRKIIAQLSDAAARAPTKIEQRIAAALSEAVRIVQGDAAPTSVPPAVEPKAELRPRLLAPLLACLNRKSLVGRHALRFATVTSAAVVCFWYFPPPFGYWIPLTVTVVLRPYAGVTLARTVQRIIGTAAGILSASALMPFVATPVSELAVMGAAFFCMTAITPFNYSLAIFFLSTGLVPFEHFVNPQLASEVAFMRLAATGIGATLAILGGHLLWPSFERNSIPSLLTRNIGSIGRYAGGALGGDRSPAALASIESAHREAGLDLTNLQAAVQRSISEIGGDSGALHAAIGASAGLQRLMNALNTAMAGAPEPTAMRAQLAAIARDLTPHLRRLGADGSPLAAVFPASIGPP